MKIGLVSLQFEETATGGGGVHVENICDHFLNSGEEITIISIHTDKTLPSAKLEEWEVPYSIEKRENLQVVRLLIDKGLEQPYVGDKPTELDRIKRFCTAAVDWIKQFGKDLDVVNLHGHHMVPGLIAKELQDFDAKVVSTIHALETTYMSKQGEFLGASAVTEDIVSNMRSWEAMCRFADKVIVNSPQVRDEFLEIIREQGDDPEKYRERIILLSSGCNKDFLMSDEEVEEKLKTKPEVINLVTFCRIDPSKGVEYSIRGAKKAARLSDYNFSLTIAGIPDPPEYIDKVNEELEGKPDNLEVKFKLYKSISPVPEKKKILDDKHIYIFPSLKEPFGMSIIEASARGALVVSADSNGPRHILGPDKAKELEWGLDAEYGTLVKIPDDIDKALAENMGKAIVYTVDNWETCKNKVVPLNKRIRRNWTWEGISEQYLEIFS